MKIVILIIVLILGIVLVKNWLSPNFIIEKEICENETIKVCKQVKVEDIRLCNGNICHASTIDRKSPNPQLSFDWLEEYCECVECYDKESNSITLDGCVWEYDKCWKYSCTSEGNNYIVRVER